MIKVWINNIKRIVFFIFVIVFFMALLNGNLRFQFLDNLAFSGLARVHYSFNKPKNKDNRYIVVDCPKIPVPETESSFDILLNVLKEIEVKEPKVVIFDTDVGLPSNSRFHLWFSTGDLKEKSVFIAPFGDIHSNLFYLRKPIYFLTNSVFQVDKTSNLIVKQFLGSPIYPSAGKKVESIYKGESNNHESMQIELKVSIPSSIFYHFLDDDIYRISHRTLLNNSERFPSLKDKIVLIRTGSRSIFDTLFLTPIGVLKPHTILFNDIETRLSGGLKEISTFKQNMILFVVIIIIIILFIKLPLFAALLVSLLMYELQFIFFYYFFHSKILLSYTAFILWPLLTILVALLMGIKKLSVSQRELKELDRLKKIIQLQNKELVSTNKFKELARVHSGIYHEISNPLHNMINTLKLVKLDKSIADESVELIDLAYQETERLKRLSQSLKKMHKPLNEEKRLFSVTKVFKYTYRLLQGSLQAKKIEIEVNYFDGDVKINGNPDMLQQVYLNLILNAIDAISDNGQIQVDFDVFDNKFLFTIQDTGSGLTDIDKNKLFTPFYTSKGENGTGMGLFVSREIIRELGGDLYHNDNSNLGGASFCIEFKKDTFTVESLQAKP